MHAVNCFTIPEYGLQVEETLASGDAAGARALARYWWAWTLAGTGSGALLDLGCGCGYGSRILAEQRPGRRIFALDRDRRAILTACAEFPMVNIRYLIHDLALRWPASPPAASPCDLAIAFDVVEYIRHRDLFFEQLTARLAPSGAFVSSIGNPDGPDWEPAGDHGRVVAFDDATYQRQLRRYFKTVQRYRLADDLAGVKVAGPEYQRFSYAHKLNSELPALQLDNLYWCSDPV